MPMINGVKMACEPCIRGHRSTKCGHANERLMVPVRKPGRPLSACPHPRDRPCNCGSVTAAIPKKQACGCGGNTSGTSPVVSDLQDSGLSPTEPTSPTRAAFKVQKPTAKPHSNRKQSFDITHLERMDMNNVNFVSFENRPSNGVSMIYPNGYAISGTPQDYGFVPQFPHFQPQDYKIPMQPPLHVTPEVSARMISLGGGIQQDVVEQSFATPIDLKNDTGNDSNGTFPAPPTLTKVTGREENGQSNGNSCCPAKQPSRSQSSSSASSISEPQEPTAGGCCSSKPHPPIVKDEPISTDGTPMNLTPQVDHRMLLGHGMPFSPALYSQYMPQGTVFTYPPSYGSFSNPLEPSSWRQSSRANSYIIPGTNSPMPSSVPTFLPVSIMETKDTVHTCGCGDGCQCVGCAAHPYNDATQSYVRSAYSSMATEQRPSEHYANGSSPTAVEGAEVNGSHGTETVKANTPMSSASGNGEEPNLSASDFFFVNYPLSECGGDTESCPCGDECKCLGCTIHNWPARPAEL